MQIKLQFNQKTVVKAVDAKNTGTVNKHWRDGRDLQYLYVSVAAGLPAPSESDMIEKGIDLFPDELEQAVISSEGNIDLYVYANLETDTTTKARLVIEV